MGLRCKKYRLSMALLVHCPALVAFCIWPRYVVMLIYDETISQCKGQLWSVVEAGTDMTMEILRQRQFVDELCNAPVI